MMTNKEFIKRLKNIDMIYKTDENGNVSEIISCGETYENHFKQLEKDLEILEILKENIKFIDYRIFTDRIVIYVPKHYRENIKEWLEK
jgi:hypothetical protein